MIKSFLIKPSDHFGGVIRNNFITRTIVTGGDVAIGVWNSASTQVLNNTIILNGDYRVVKNGSSLLAVTSMIGINGKLSSCLRRRATSCPSMSGKMTSSSS